MIWVLRSINQHKQTIIAIAMSAWLLSCSETPEATTAETKGDRQVAVAEITKNREKYLEKSVFVRSDIQEILGEATFTLEKERLFGGEELLVIDPSPTQASYEPGIKVLVRGKIEQFTLDDLDEYGLKGDRSLYAKYEGKPSLIADSILLSPDPGDLTRTPETYYDKLIAVEGEVDDVIAPGIFELDEEQAFRGEDLLVIGAEANWEVREDAIVIVTGILRPFDSDKFQQNYDLNWDSSLQQQIEAEYANRPVLVAKDIDRIKQEED